MRHTERKYYIHEQKVYVHVLTRSSPSSTYSKYDIYYLCVFSHLSIISCCLLERRLSIRTICESVSSVDGSFYDSNLHAKCSIFMV